MAFYDCAWVVWTIEGFFSSLICLTGITGNLLVLYVMKKLKDRTPAGYLIRTLACSDFSYVFLRFLCGAFPALIFQNNFQNRFYGYMSMVINPVAQVGFCVTSCVTVLLAFHRYRAASSTRPLATESTLRKIKIMIVVSVTISIIMNIPRFLENDWDYDPNNGNLSHTPPPNKRLLKHYAYTVVYRGIVYSTVFNRLPMFLLPFFTTRLVLCLRRLRLNTAAKLNISQRRKTTTERKITILCILISVIFIVCNITGIVFRSYYIHRFKQRKNKTEIPYIEICGPWDITAMVSNMLYLVNSSGIFFIYLKLSTKFRNVITAIPDKLLSWKPRYALQFPSRVDSTGQGTLVIHARDKIELDDLSWAIPKGTKKLKTGDKVSRESPRGIPRNMAHINLALEESMDESSLTVSSGERLSDYAEEPSKRK